jgi:glutaredoxin
MRRHILVLLLLLPALAQAQVYRWVDETGKVQYSDKPPPPSAKNVQKKSMAGGSGSIPLPYALHEAVKNFPVTLYTNEDCKELCVQARDLLTKRGVPFKEVSIEDRQGMENFKKLTGGAYFPVLSVGRDMQKGYESSIYHGALDSAGYPRNSLLPPGVQARQLIRPEKKPPADNAAAPPAEGADSERAPADSGAPR